MSGALKWAWTGASAHSGAPRSTGGNSITWSHGIKKFHMGGLHYDYNNNQSPYILDSKTFVLAFDFNKLLTLKKYTAKWSQRLKCSTQTGLNNISKKDKWCLHVCTEMHYVNVLITHMDKDSLVHLKLLNNKTGLSHIYNFSRGDARYCFLPSILYQSTFHTVPATVCHNILFLVNFEGFFITFGQFWRIFQYFW